MNEISSPLLFASHGRAWRYTLNPPSRRAGGQAWDAGAVEEWCELAPGVTPTAACESVVQGEGRGRAGRVQRQEVVHGIGLCARPASHFARAIDA